MNFYDALNQGDASLKEPHLTSILFYLFRETHKDLPENSLIDFFIESYLSHLSKPRDCDFDIDASLKIEEILSDHDTRKDTDITIYLNGYNEKTVINIENKISNLSYQQGQIEEQTRLIKIKYPEYGIQNVLLLPYMTDKDVTINDETKVIYWIGDGNSLTQKITEYINSILSSNDYPSEKKDVLKNWVWFLQTFSNVLEQDMLSNETMPRGPRNSYRYSMFEYLSQIKDRWETYFQEDPENVTVKQLLSKFDEMVCSDLREFNPANAEEMIAKFQRGALEAQPRIMTINDRNRINFGITNPIDKQLFYYPDSPNGDNGGRWKETRIKPLHRMSEQNLYVVFWKNKTTNKVEASIYDH